MSKFKLFSIAFIAMFFTACAASLEIFDSSKNKVDGVPFRAPALYVFSGKFTKHSEVGNGCEKIGFSDIHSLPLGDLYYANVKTASLAKSEFSIEFTEQGALKRIVLNSDTTIDDVASGVTKLLSITSPIADGVLEKNFRADAQLPCDTGKVVDSMKTFEEFKRDLSP